MQRGATLLGLRKLVNSFGGAKLCYGEPIRNGERVVIPVSRVSTFGGWGWGRGRDSADGWGDGGGGGGGLEAAPVGFIDIGPEGTRFESIPDPMSNARALRTSASALGALASGLATAAAIRRARRSLPGGAGVSAGRKLLGRGR